MPDLVQHLAWVKSQIVEISVEELRGAAASRLLDLREREELGDGQIPGAEHLPRGLLELRIEALVPDRRAELVLYCAGGDRSALAARSLGELGYTRVRSLAGGYAAWKRAGGAILRVDKLPPEEAARYARQLRLPEVGEAGQRQLREARVLVLGAGGLGSPAALYLAAAGIGTIGIVDEDTVEASNLHRQIIHSTTSIGEAKVDSAARRLEDLDPAVQVERHRLRLDGDSAQALLSAYDLVVDGSDNLATRYVLADAARALGRPVIHASVFRFEGQITVFPAVDGPCYRCLHPNPPAPGTIVSCDEAGVLGVVPGILGVLQATEAVKLLLGLGRSLAGRLLHYDALTMRFSEFELPRDPTCASCGPRGATLSTAWSRSARQ